MIQMIVAMRDAKAEVFGRPVYVRTIGEAIRSFDDEINRESEDNPLYKHPEDYQLYHLGTMDDSDGSILAVTPIKLLVQGAEVIRGKGTMNMVKNISKV